MVKVDIHKISVLPPGADGIKCNVGSVFSMGLSLKKQKQDGQKAIAHPPALYRKISK